VVLDNADIDQAARAAMFSRFPQNYDVRLTYSAEFPFRWNAR
jgi:hypothetical protein